MNFLLAKKKKKRNFSWNYIYIKSLVLQNPLIAGGLSAILFADVTCGFYFQKIIKPLGEMCSHHQNCNIMWSFLLCLCVFISCCVCVRRLCRWVSSISRGSLCCCVWGLQVLYSLCWGNTLSSDSFCLTSAASRDSNTGSTPVRWVCATICYNSFSTSRV